MRKLNLSSKSFFYLIGIYAQTKDLVQYVNTCKELIPILDWVMETHILLPVCLMPCIRGLHRPERMVKVGNINMQ